jgi:hypothetical protein
MHTREADRGLGSAAGEVAAHAKAIARLEAKLAVEEVKDKLGALGLGLGFGLGSAVLGVFTLALALATIVAALATFLPTWLAFLVVTVAVGAGAAVLAALAFRTLRRSTPPVPREAIEDAKLTAEALKGHGNGRSTYS